MENVLEIKDLCITYPTMQGDNYAVNGLDLAIKRREIFGLVGESGCGKSMTALSILRLISPPGRIDGGEIFIDGENAFALSEVDMQSKIRGEKASMIFQEPMTSLNPLIKVGEQIAETIRVHKGVGKKEARFAAMDLMKKVGIPEAEKRLDVYPNSLSGGMRQRVMIAIAMCCKPKLLIADEPTTALDVTIQAQILKLMKEMRDSTGTSILFITHDLGVVANICDRVGVMYCGAVVEEGMTSEIIRHPLHPYTKGLIGAVPKLGDSDRVLYSIHGLVPSINRGGCGCAFAERCDFCKEQCMEKKPVRTDISESHRVCCHIYDEA